MMRKKGARSLRATLFALCIAVILVMSLLLSGILISQHRAITSLSGSLRTIDSFYLFNTLLNRFHQSFNLYANSLSRRELQDCYDQLKALGETAGNMASSFPQEASIVKNQSLIEQYIASSSSLLEQGATLTEPEFWSRFDQSSLLLGEINDNVHKVQSFYLESISRLSTQSMRDWQTQLQLSLLVALVSLTLLLLFIHRCIEGVTSPILRLAQYAQKIAEGDFSQRLQPPAAPEIKEISLLSSTFASMAKTIEEQMCALRDKIDLTRQLHALEIQNMNIRLCLAEKEMNLMQSMINPHFLFNCLGTVSSMAVLENAPRTQALAAKIARYLRASIDLVGARIPLRQELELLKQYLYIQSVRLGQRIATSVQCDPACEAAVVPAMFLQPIVENAIVHGLCDCVADGKIAVCVAIEKEGRIGVTVMDNGCGIPPDRLEHLRGMLHTPFKQGQDCVGLHSIISQLDILFGQNYVFDMKSAPGRGTTVRMALPFLAQEDGMK